MDSGKQRCSGSSRPSLAQHQPRLCQEQTGGTNRERAACGEEKVEKGNKRGRKQRGDEAIAVK